MSHQALGRRRFLAGVAGVGLSSALALPAAPPAGATLPTVNMEYVVVQSQVEPGRANSGLAGDDSVRAVQSALRAQGFGTTVDGWFGTGTASDYAAWQRRLGYSGLAANGVPGPTSLTKLGDGRYTVVRKISVGGMTTYSGKTVNQRTRSMLAAADAKVAFTIVVSQGSYNPGGVAASAGTHDGGGAVDISVSALTSTQRWQAVAALRSVGFAAWLRTPDQGSWPYHIHAIAIGDTDLSTGARSQVKDYYSGLNGLANHAADNTPSAYRRAFTWWEQYLRG